MAHPVIPVVIIALLFAVLSILSLLVLGVRNRRLMPVVIAGLCCCYLCIADGGMFPEAERFLPTESLMNQFSKQYGEVRSGRIRAVSLGKWIWRLCVEENHKDWRRASLRGRMPTPVSAKKVIQKKPSAPPVVVKLPKFTFITTVTTVHTIAFRDNAENRPFYITGHSLCVIFVSLLALMVYARPRFKNKVETITG